LQHKATQASASVGRGLDTVLSEPLWPFLHSEPQAPVQQYRLANSPYHPYPHPAARHRRGRLLLRNLGNHTACTLGLSRSLESRRL
jgi:hypothetical protein